MAYDAGGERGTVKALYLADIQAKIGRNSGRLGAGYYLFY